MEVTDVRTQLQQQVCGRAGVVIRFGAVWIFAEVVQDGGKHLFRSIEEGDAAAFQFLEVLWLQHQIPAVHRRIGTQHLFHFFDVIADAGGRPHVRHGVLVVRIVFADELQQLGVEVFPARQFAFIQRLEHAGRELTLKEAG
ncbi:hypothetical protein D3C76_1451980 [compost metagenome]